MFHPTQQLQSFGHIAAEYAPCSSIVTLPVGVDSMSYPSWGEKTANSYLGANHAVPLASIGGVAYERSPASLTRDENQIEVIIARKPVLEFDDAVDRHASAVPQIYQAQAQASKSFNEDIDRIWVANDYSVRCSK